MSDSLLAKIRQRVIELMITQDVSRVEATRLAAKQFGRTIKDGARPKPKPKLDTNNTGSSNNLREELFQKILAIKSRMKDDAKPDGMIKRVIARIRLKEDEPDAPTPPPTPVEATPSSTMLDCMCGVYVGRSSREMLNKEFDNGPFQDDPTTSNWRKSLDQKPRVPENEVNALDPLEVQRAFENQQANVIAFPRVSK
jgi:hypothetical protein